MSRAPCFEGDIFTDHFGGDIFTDLPQMMNDELTVRRHETIVMTNVANRGSQEAWDVRRSPVPGRANGESIPRWIASIQRLMLARVGRGAAAGKE